MPVLSLVLFRLYRARGGLRKQLALHGVLWQTSPVRFMRESYRIVISGSEYGNLTQLVLCTFYSLYLQLIHGSYCEPSLGQGGEQSRIPTTNLPVCHSSHQKSSVKFKKKQACEGVGLGFIRTRRTKRSKSGYNRVRSEPEPLINE